MGEWTRDELERAFAAYQARAADAGRSGDWSSWADQFTEDAVYIEHHYGRFDGRDAIRAWISKTMSQYPGKHMPEFPIGWYVIDDERGWIVCQVFNRMADAGDGAVHEADNWTLLKYAGNDQWSYEEDVYNPAEFGTMVAAWEQARASSSQ